MNYPKKVMSLKELIEMGFRESELMEVYRMRNNGIAWKSGSAINSPIMFSTEDFERYRKSKCTGG